MFEWQQAGFFKKFKRGNKTVIKKTSILCFGKDWSESPTSNNHIMSRLAKNNKVLWVNSVGMRIPSIFSLKDIKKVFKKIKENVGGSSKSSDNLIILTPIGIPLWRFKVIRKLNRTNLMQYNKKKCQQL